MSEKRRGDARREERGRKRVFNDAFYKAPEGGGGEEAEATK